MAILGVRRIDHGEGRPLMYVYSYRSSRAVALGPTEQDFAVELSQSALEAFCAQLADVVDRSYHVGSSDHLAELRVAGCLLYKALFPVLEAYLPVLAARLRDTDESLLVRTNDPLVPWELLHDGDGFFGLKYDLACQSVVETPIAAGRPIGALRSALIVIDPRSDLPEARREGEQVVEWLTRHGADCTVLSRSQATLVKVMNELAAGGCDLLHYCGHVAVSPRSNQAALLLQGDNELDVRTLKATLGELDAGTGASRGVAPPVVFINGCVSAGHLSNLCSSFMATGSQIVVGTRYEIPEGAGRSFAEELYTRLMSGTPAGAAMREARAIASAGEDAAWASFVLFGDPSARMSPAEPPRTAPIADRAEPAARPDLTGPALDHAIVRELDTDAAAALERAAASARAGALTSMHLLVAMLRADDSPLAAEVARTGIEPAELARELEPLLDIEAPGVDSIELSDTVERVLAAARERARTAGRELTSLADLSATMAEDREGTAGRLLELLGLVPRAREAHGRVAEDRPGSLFDEAGDLQERYLAESTLAALRAALAIARSRGEMLSSYAAFLGFGAAGSAALRTALLDQGKAGAGLARALAPEARRIEASRALRMSDLSARAFNAVERAGAAAASAGADQVDDALLLRELLREEGAAARELLEQHRIDPDRLAESLGA